RLEHERLEAERIEQERAHQAEAERLKQKGIQAAAESLKQEALEPVEVVALVSSQTPESKSVQWLKEHKWHIMGCVGVVVVVGAGGKICGGVPVTRSRKICDANSLLEWLEYIAQLFAGCDPG
ncbi:hypothetical protein M408DRAFT_13428, partial [Serendipita vermifera MAFF 305830]